MVFRRSDFYISAAHYSLRLCLGVSAAGNAVVSLVLSSDRRLPRTCYLAVAYRKTS